MRHDRWGTPRRGRSTMAALALATLVAAAHAAPATADRAPDRTPGARCTAPGPDPFAIRLVPTPAANGAAGTVRLRFADSPFVVAVTRDGHHAYDAILSVTGLPRDGTVPVAWAAAPELDHVQKLGVPGEDGTLRARIHLNKFLVFVTAEPSAEVERWSGPILLRGISPSGRMHSLAGHGPFAGEPCGTLSPF